MATTTYTAGTTLGSDGTSLLRLQSSGGILFKAATTIEIRTGSITGPVVGKVTVTTGNLDVLGDRHVGETM